MNRLITAALVLAAATSLLAQDAELTKAQIAAKCAAGGGCMFVTRDALMSIIRSASEAAYRQGAESCGNAI